MSLNSQTNKYCCCRCGVGGYSIGLYAKIKGIDTKKAYKELLDKECFSINKSNIEISPINLLADVENRDAVYREFLDMLRLDINHKEYLRGLGLLNGSIEDNLYKSIPKNYIRRRLIANNLSKKYNLCGIPGFFQEEDFKWCFSRMDGFFVPVFDKDGYIKGLSIHLDKPFNNNSDIWFSSSNKINGTRAKNWIMKNNISELTKSIFLTDNFLLGNFIKENTSEPFIVFQNITNSYMVLREIEKTNIKNIIFIVRLPQTNNNLDYIIRRVFRDLLPLDYNIDVKYITDFTDFFDDNFSDNYTLKKLIKKGS